MIINLADEEILALALAGADSRACQELHVGSRRAIDDYRSVVKLIGVGVVAELGRRGTCVNADVI